MEKTREKRVHVYGDVEKVFGSPVAEIEQDGKFRVAGRRCDSGDASVVVNAIVRLIARIPGGSAQVQLQSIADQCVRLLPKPVTTLPVTPAVAATPTPSKKSG